MQHDVVPVRPPLKPAGLPFPAVAAELGLSLRRIREMVQAGNLVVLGRGRKKVVSTRSFEREQARRAKRRFIPETSENVPVEAATSGDRLLDDPPPSGYSDTAMIRTPQPRPTTLLPISRAAAIVGLSDKTMRRIIERGEIPAVSIGPRRRINSEVLRQWALGRRG